MDIWGTAGAFLLVGTIPTTDKVSPSSSSLFFALPKLMIPSWQQSKGAYGDDESLRAFLGLDAVLHSNGSGWVLTSRADSTSTPRLAQVYSSHEGQHLLIS